MVVSSSGLKLKNRRKDFRELAYNFKICIVVLPGFLNTVCLKYITVTTLKTLSDTGLIK